MLFFLPLKGNSGDVESIESSNFSSWVGDVIRITRFVMASYSDTEFELLEKWKGSRPSQNTMPTSVVELERKGIVSTKDGGVTNQCKAVIASTT